MNRHLNRLKASLLFMFLSFLILGGYKILFGAVLLTADIPESMFLPLVIAFLVGGVYLLGWLVQKVGRRYR